MYCNAALGDFLSSIGVSLCKAVKFVASWFVSFIRVEFYFINVFLSQPGLTTDLMKCVRVDKKLFKYWTRNFLSKDSRR